MTAFGPFAYLHEDKIIWLQIILNTEGKCSEFKQSTSENFKKNIWTSIPPEHWPAIIPAYDPTVSQSHFIFTRNEDNTLSRYYVTKLRSETEAVAKDPYRVMRQNYTKLHFSSMMPIIDTVQKQTMIQAFWVPTEEQQTSLKAQYREFQQTNEAIWHVDPKDTSKNMPNLPLDFQSTQRGEAKPEITNTGLNPHQQWKVKMMLQETMTTLKADSTSSEEYAAALHFLIDKTGPITPFSETTQKNIEALRTLISTTDINNNSYLKKDFYTKLDTTDKKKPIQALTEKDTGYAATIGAIIFYIDHLLEAEIRQFFPDYKLEIIKPSLLTTNFKIGYSTLSNAEEVEEASHRLSPEEIRDIDNLNQAISFPDTLYTINDQSLIELQKNLDNILKRQAITINIANTLSLMLNPNNEEERYTQKIKNTIELSQTILEQRTFFTQILSSLANTDQSAPFIPSQSNLKKLTDISHFTKLLKTYNTAEQVAILGFILNYYLKNNESNPLFSSKFFENCDSQVLSEFRKQELNSLSEQDKMYYGQIIFLLNIEPSSLETLSNTELKSLQTAFEAAFPIDDSNTKLGILLVTDPNQKISDLLSLQEKIDTLLLSKKLKKFFQETHSINKKQELSLLLPNLEETNQSYGRIAHNTIVLLGALTQFSTEQQIEVLLILFDTQQVSARAAHDLYGPFRSVEFPVILNLIQDLSREKLGTFLKGHNAKYFIYTLFDQYNRLYEKDPTVLLASFSEDVLDKLCPQISIEQMKNDFGKDYEELISMVETAITDRTHLIKNIVSLISLGRYSDQILDKIKTCTSLKELKALLIHSIDNGSTEAHYYVYLAFQQISSYESFLLAQMSPIEKRQYQQFRSLGKIGDIIQLELQCLRQNKGCEVKLANLETALNELPEKLSDAELQAILNEPNNAFTQALFAPTLPVARGFTFFEQKKRPEPDFAILAEIRNTLTSISPTMSRRA